MPAVAKYCWLIMFERVCNNLISSLVNGHASMSLILCNVNWTCVNILSRNIQASNLGLYYNSLPGFRRVSNTSVYYTLWCCSMWFSPWLYAWWTIAQRVAPWLSVFGILGPFIKTVLIVCILNHGIKSHQMTDGFGLFGPFIKTFLIVCIMNHGVMRHHVIDGFEHWDRFFKTQMIVVMVTLCMTDEWLNNESSHNRWILTKVG